VGLVPQFGAGAVEGQDPQVVHVKGSDVAWNLVVECHGWVKQGGLNKGVKQGGLNNSSITDYWFLG
jgi:hypothetical protein